MIFKKSNKCTLYHFCFLLICLFSNFGFAVKSETDFPRKVPNVIVISADTLSARHLGSYGYQRDTSPFLDSLAQDSVFFEKVTSQAAYTLASHYSIFTGLFPQSHHVQIEIQKNSSTVLNPQFKTLFEYLKGVNYSTHWFGQTDEIELDLRRGLERGIDSFDKLDFADDKQFVKVKERVQNIAASGPQAKLIFFHSYFVHDPYTPKLSYLKKFDPLNNADSSIEIKRKKKRSEYNVSKDKPETIDRFKSEYDAGIRTFDDKVKNLVEILREHKLFENSIIIFTSDHGESFGEHGNFFHSEPYQVETAVPLFIKIPGQKPIKIKDNVYSVDILPTVLDVLGIKPSNEFDGRSLKELFSNGSVKKIPWILGVGYFSETISDGKYKLNVFRKKDPELYNFESDPWEINNLSFNKPDLLKTFQRKLEEMKFERTKNRFFSEKYRGPLRLQWFIPDGLRADRGDFNIFKWAEEGKLPNLKKMMREGVYGYSIPDFPSHTPINFASLLTGTHPSVHGIADGPMHVEGVPLKKPSAPGFASYTKRVAPIWKIVEDFGKSVFLLSVPGSTPPEIKGTTVRGRWGPWGADTFNVVFESKELFPLRKEQARGLRLFFLGEALTKFVEGVETKNKNEVKKEYTFEAHGGRFFGFQKLTIKNKKIRSLGQLNFKVGNSDFSLKMGEWSQWHPITLEFKGVKFQSQVKIKVIKIWNDGNFRLRVLYNNVNRLNTEPAEAADYLTAKVGPMTDHLDNWPPQLIFEKEDKDAALDEIKSSLLMHKNSTRLVGRDLDPEVFIHDTYTPNQMLESRWWHGNIDRTNPNFNKKLEKKSWDEVLDMYKGIDSVLGEALARAEHNLVVAFSSDHGVCPLHRLVHLNNLFAKKGWLKFTVNRETGEPEIDWKNTKVIYLKMLHVYVNPNGLDGDWKRGKGDEYEKLRDEVIQSLSELKDLNGVKPLVRALKWEAANETYDLPMDRIGDLVLEVKVNYFWYEEVNESLNLFSNPLTTGYKQSLNPKDNECMWTPFVLWGQGVKKGVKLSEPISHVDQLPTLLRLLNIPIPKHVQGKVLETAIQDDVLNSANR